MQDFSIVPPTGSGSSKERELQQELDKTRTWAAEMQSQRDRFKNELSSGCGAWPRSRSRQNDDNRRAQPYKGAASKAMGKGGKGGGEGGKNGRWY